MVTIAQMTKWDFDVLMWTEVGTCWRKANFCDNWENRITNTNKKTKATFGCNTAELDNTKLLQMGGVGITLAGETIQRSIESGKDPSGLGRWSWDCIQEKQGQKTRVVLAHHPCTNVGQGKNCCRSTQTILSSQTDH